MPDYALMYKNLFQAVTLAIDILQEAQLSAEETYISSKPANIIVLKTKLEHDNHSVIEKNSNNSSV